MQDDDPYNRYHHFLEEIQKILHKCGMSEIYIVNPYECFLLMCLLTDCPPAVFADIWEMSYEDKDGEFVKSNNQKFINKRKNHVKYLDSRIFTGYNEQACNKNAVFFCCRRIFRKLPVADPED